MKSRIKKRIASGEDNYVKRVAEGDELRAKAAAAGVSVGEMLRDYSLKTNLQTRRRETIDGKMLCSTCKSYQSLKLFYVHVTSTGYKKYDSRCDECRKLEGTARRLRLSIDAYRAIVEQAGGRCGICGDVFKRPSVDHCHKSMRIRGVLCTACNSALGLMKDSPARLRAAADYLEQRGE